MPLSPIRALKKTTQQNPSIQSLDRGLFTLETVAKAQDPMAPGQLTDLLKIDRSSVFRREEARFPGPSRRTSGLHSRPSIGRISRRQDWSRMLITCSHDHRKRLAVEIRETTHLAAREGKDAFFIDHYAYTNQVPAISGQTGEFVLLYYTAHGKAMLADYGIDELNAFFGCAAFQVHTPTTIVSLKQLAKECAAIKASGAAIDREEYIPGVRCIAAPIRECDAMATRKVVQVALEIGAVLSTEAAD